MRITINPGHHFPEDIGFKGITKNEAELVYNYAELLVAKLVEEGHTAEIICEDKILDIVEKTNLFSTDIFISLHLKSSPTKELYGTETFYFKTSEDGLKLATYIQNSVKNAILQYRVAQRPDMDPQEVDNISNKPLNDSRVFIIDKTDAPAILIDIGFINNPLEEDILINHINEIVTALYNGINDYIIYKNDKLDTADTTED